MADRASIFTDPALVELLRTRFVTVAVDVDDTQHREGELGDYYRRVVLQRRGMHLGRSTQGHYVFDAAGQLLRGSNHRDSAILRRHLERVLGQSAARASANPPLVTPPRSSRIPRGAAIVEVFTRVLEAEWPEPKSDSDRARRRSLGRDFLWITASEQRALCAATPTFPDTLARRLVRFHVIDNTRCGGLVWNRAAARTIDFAVKKTETGCEVSGTARCETVDGRRRCRVVFAGASSGANGELDRFDLTARAVFAGDGKWSTGAPPGEYTVGIALRIAESFYANQVMPRGLTAREEEYLEAPCTGLARR